MGSDPFVAVTGRVLVAPLDTAFPTAATEEYGAEFVDVGLVTPEGATIQSGQTKETFGAWQLFGPARVSITGRTFHIGFQLEAWNEDTVKLAYGGGEVEAITGGFEYTPPLGGETDFRALALEAVDGDLVYRWHIFKGEASDDVETTLQRNSLGVLPIGFEVIWPSDGSAPWKLQSTDPNFIPGFLSS